jgi:hypothetical protein
MQTASELTVTYDGVEIRYEERSDRWKFCLRGRERSADSLAKAKEAIDKPEPKEKKPFERISAYYQKGWGGGFIKVQITSIAEDSPYGSRTDVWINNEGTREKKPASSLYAITPANEKLIADWTVAETQRKALEQEQRDIVEKLEQAKVE